MTSRLSFLSVIFSLLFSIGAFSADEKEIEKLLVKTGSKEQISYMVPSIEEHMQAALVHSQNKKIDQAVSEAIIKRLRKTDFLATIKNGLVKNLSKEDLEKINEWYSSDISKKITDHEIAGSKLSPEELQSFSEGLKTTPPKKERIQILVGIMNYTGGLELNTEITKTIMFAREMGINKAKPAEEQKSTVEILSKIELKIPQLKQYLANNILVSMLRIYRDLSDQELIQYVQFLSKEHTIRFSQIMVSGYREGFSSSLKGADRSIASEIEAAE